MRGANTILPIEKKRKFVVLTVYMTVYTVDVKASAVKLIICMRGPDRDIYMMALCTNDVVPAAPHAQMSCSTAHPAHLYAFISDSSPPQE